MKGTWNVAIEIIWHSGLLKVCPVTKKLLDILLIISNTPQELIKFLQFRNENINQSPIYL